MAAHDEQVEKVARGRHKLSKGQRIGQLTLTVATRIATWESVCDCGNTHTATEWRYLHGNVTSCAPCGKARGAARHRTHGLGGATPHPLYVTWQQMVHRCHRPLNKRFSSYGGRGISVCDRWRFGEDGLTGTECFILDMGDRPNGMSIDRINNDGNYEPSNCRWATQTQQMRNRAIAINTDEVARLMAEGLTGAQIAKVMSRHKNSIYSAMKRINATPALGAAA